MSDDAARANWGGGWRIPTEAEWDELCEQCTWTWTTQNGVNGYKVTSDKNGNSIFLPAAGYYWSSSLYDADTIGYYWLSSLDIDYPILACSVSISSGYWSEGTKHRGGGHSVRPVCP